MTDSQLGWARNWVKTSTTVGNFSAATFDADIREGKLIAGNGIVVLVELAGRGAGFRPIHPAPGDKLKITVKAPPWIPVEEVRLVTSAGTQIIASDLPRPDPFGTETTRYKVALDLSKAIEAAPESQRAETDAALKALGIGLGRLCARMYFLAEQAKADVGITYRQFELFRDARANGLPDDRAALVACRADKGAADTFLGVIRLAEAKSGSAQ